MARHAPAPRSRCGLEVDQSSPTPPTIGSDGEILTNAHGLADVDRTVVRLADGRQFIGKVVGLDRTPTSRW
jgi:S1-C subfamily serine protease